MVRQDTSDGHSERHGITWRASRQMHTCLQEKEQRSQLENECNQDKRCAQVMVGMPLRLCFFPVARWCLRAPCMHSSVNRNHKENGDQEGSDDEQKTQEGELKESAGPGMEKEEQAQLGERGG